MSSITLMAILLLLKHNQPMISWISWLKAIKINLISWVNVFPFFRISTLLLPDFFLSLSWWVNCAISEWSLQNKLVFEGFGIWGYLLNHQFFYSERAFSILSILKICWTLKRQPPTLIVYKENTPFFIYFSVIVLFKHVKNTMCV